MMEFTNTYRVDLREMNFLLWEQFRIDKTVLQSPMINDYDKDFVTDLLFRARDFAYNEIGPTYQASDREGCELLEDGSVRIPSCFYPVWEKYDEAQWGRLSAPPEYNGLACPYIVAQMINEIYMGASPTFMVYSGFCSPGMYLIERFGTQALKDKFCIPLAENRWGACLCMTEPNAGTDVGAGRSKAIPQDDGSYHIEGGKIFISAGMHDLMENIVYIVLARVEGAPQGTTGLSCFIVPRFEQDENGEFIDNHVRCLGIEKKMGLHGCSTAQLAFGEGGVCKGYLLGERENIGIRQLSTMMNMARIATGIYALGLSSRAYMSAVEYAQERIQGTDFRQAFNPKAEKVPIIRHNDVRRMLLEMKSKVEGCRALVVKLTYHQSFVGDIELRLRDEVGIYDEIHDDLKYHQNIVNLLTPIVKAYNSDQAWRVCELAIQVFGGHGYISDHPVEQCARDVKILAIWEGTNFIQSADLMRDKLAMGRPSKLFDLFQNEVNKDIEKMRASGFMNAELDSLVEHLGILVDTHKLMGTWVRERKIELIFGVSTRILEMMAEVTLSWLLLDAAIVAHQALENLSDEKDEAFYKGKIASAEFYVRNILPGVKSKADIIASEDTSFTDIDLGIFNERSDMFA